MPFEPLPTQPSASAQADQATPQDSFQPLTAVEQSQLEGERYETLQAKYGTPGQQAIAGAEALGQGVAGPLAPLVETQALGVKPEDIRGREEANPITHAAGIVGGLLVPTGEAALLGRVGAGATKLATKALPKLAGEGVLAGIGRDAVRLAAENATYQAGDEVSKMIKEDPNQSLGSAVSNIGLAGLLGGTVGGGLGSVSSLWKAANDTKLGEIAGDFKARMQEHLRIEPTPEPAIEAPKQTGEVFDPFTKETKTITKTLPEAAEGPKFDPFTKQEVPEGKAAVQASKETMGVPKPYEPTSPESPAHIRYDELKAEREANRELSVGEKLADAVVAKAHDFLTGGIGGAIGATVGKLTGIPGAAAVGALLGERSLGPFFKSTLPSLTKSLVEKAPSGEGLKAAVDYATQVVRGVRNTGQAIDSLFRAGSKLSIPESTQPSPESRKRIDAALHVFQQDPGKMSLVGGSIGHYLPDHAAAIGSNMSNMVSFLNSLRPQDTGKMPLDPPTEHSQAVKSQYNRVLDIAQQPLIVFESIKKGTFTSEDAMALHTMYPQLYDGWRQQVMNRIVEAKAAGETIPYDTRLGLSMFLGQPLDSTMLPEAILAAQPQPQQPPQPQQGSKPRKMSQASASNSLKLAKSSQTATQAAESMHTTGKA